MSRRTIMVLDDHPVIRQGVVGVLRSDQLLEVTGDFGRSDELLAAMKKAPPDLVVLDFQLGQSDVDGLNLMLRIRRQYEDTRIIILSAIERPSNVHALLKHGASGFVGKTQELDSLLTAVRAVLGGRQFVLPELPPMTERPNAEVRPLTAREREVIRCCLAGMTTKAIAEKFHRTEATISTQKKSAYRKLGVESDPDLHRANADGLLADLL